MTGKASNADFCRRTDVNFLADECGTPLLRSSLRKHRSSWLTTTSLAAKSDIAGLSRERKNESRHPHTSLSHQVHSSSTQCPARNHWPPILRYQRHSKIGSKLMPPGEGVSMRRMSAMPSRSRSISCTSTAVFLRWGLSRKGGSAGCIQLVAYRRVS